MEKELQSWNEYHGLREEIRIADSLNYQIMGILIGAVSLILTTGVAQSKPSASIAAFLCSYVVTYPGYRLLQGNRRRIWRISTYMRIFLEPKLDSVKWETRLSKQSKILLPPRTQRPSSLISQNEWFIITLLNIVAGLAAITYILKTGYNPAGKSVSALGIVFVNLFLWHKTSAEEKALRRDGDIENKFTELWELVLAKENQKSDL
jgi:hypothetical protein